MLIRSRVFWIASAIFLALALVMIWFIYLPLINQYRSQKDQVDKLKTDIANQEQFIANINQLKSKEDELNQDYELLNRALPVNISPETLLVELDGLVKQLGLNDAKITVPFDETSTNKSSGQQSKSNESSSNSSDEVKPGSQGASNPTTNSQTPAQSSITIEGEFGFDKVKELLASLRSFIRWNKIISITITNSTDKVNSNISAQVFTKDDAKTGYSGNANLLEEAQKLIIQLKTYTTLPDITAEGNFGRSDPFQPVN